MLKHIRYSQYRKTKKLTKKRIKMTKLVKANRSNMSKKLNVKYFQCLLLMLSLVTFARCAGDIDSQLRKVAKEGNEECPKMLDQWTRLDSCVAYPNKNYKYYHTIVSDGVILDKAKFETNFKPVIISIIRTNPAMKFLKENEVTLHYMYTDEAGSGQMTIIVTPDEYKNQE